MQTSLRMSVPKAAYTTIRFTDIVRSCNFLFCDAAACFCNFWHAVEDFCSKVIESLAVIRAQFDLNL